MVSSVKAVAGFCRNLWIPQLLFFITECREYTDAAWLQWTLYSEHCHTSVWSIPCSNKAVYSMNCSGRISFKCLDCFSLFLFHSTCTAFSSLSLAVLKLCAELGSHLLDCNTLWQWYETCFAYRRENREETIFSETFLACKVWKETQVWSLWYSYCSDFQWPFEIIKSDLFLRCITSGYCLLLLQYRRVWEQLMHLILTVH